MITLDEIKQQIAAFDTVDDFFTVCNKDANASIRTWGYSELDLEKSLDVFMQQLAGIDKMFSIQFAAEFARYAFAHVYEKHLEDVRDVGFAFLASDPCIDGEPVEKQLGNVEAWLKEPTAENLKLVETGIDPGRQLNAWDDELYPAADQMWLWIYENTQLLSLALVAGEADERDHKAGTLPYDWSSKACLSRSAVCSLKAIAERGRQVDKDLSAMLRKVREML